MNAAFSVWTRQRIWELTCKAVLIIKPTICTNFSNLFLEQNSLCFWQFLCPSRGVFHCTHSNGICHTGLLTACKQDQDGTSSVLILFASSMTYTPAVRTVKNSWWWTEELSETCSFIPKINLEKLVHIFGFIIRIYHDERSPERQNVKLCQPVSSYRRFGGSYKVFDLNVCQKKVERTLAKNSTKISIQSMIHFFKIIIWEFLFVNECHPVVLFLAQELAHYISVHK